MSAPEGNTNGMKFKTPEDRKAHQEAYIAHVESGLSDECFPECDPQTLRKYVAEFPIDFDTEMIGQAQRNRRLFWEKAGTDGTMGKIEGFNASSWKFNMANRFGWAEKREDKVTLPKDGATGRAGLLRRRLFNSSAWMSWGRDGCSWRNRDPVALLTLVTRASRP
jgi:hypothetical protein